MAVMHGISPSPLLLSFVSKLYHALQGIYLSTKTNTSNHSPGRFFAAQQLKLVLAYIALNYDIKPIPFRPTNLWFVNTQGPPLDSKISVRRREGTV
jgi:hypothetical protein